jgi:hypothetical protein
MKSHWLSTMQFTKFCWQNIFPQWITYVALRIPILAGKHCTKIFLLSLEIWYMGQLKNN